MTDKTLCDPNALYDHTTLHESESLIALQLILAHWYVAKISIVH